MTEHERADRTITARRIDLGPSFADVPRHFTRDGDLISSHVVATLSAAFPDGEDFFVRSVRRFRDRLEDPVLRRQVAGFIGQEAVHGREHREFNDRLHELGYPSRAFERYTRRGLRLRERFLSPEWCLATTAALEHFTATLAGLVLTTESVRLQFGHPAVRDLYVWHALEESEHRAVAFDVFREIGGSERVRVWSMNAMTAEFLVSTAVQIVVSLLGDRDTYRPGVLRRSFRALRTSPLADERLWRQLRDYNRPDFHPDDRDLAAVEEEWRERLFGDGGTLVGYLDVPAA